MALHFEFLANNDNADYVKHEIDLLSARLALKHDTVVDFF
jgi:hypothetical protein